MKEGEMRCACGTLEWEEKCIKNSGRKAWRKESIWSSSV